MYYEINSKTKMDVPSLFYEKVASLNKLRIKMNSNLSLYDFCKEYKTVPTTL